MRPLIFAVLAFTAAAQAQQRVETAPADPYEIQEFDDCSGAGWCPRMVVVPAARFTIGSPEGELGRDTDEGPRREVSIARFAVSKYEITRGQWSAFVQATRRSDPEVSGETECTWRNPGFEHEDDHPVGCVNRRDALDYAAWLTRRLGLRGSNGYRLLTEAEWEYAARGGTATPYLWGSDWSAGCAFMNASVLRRCADGYANTAPVGSFRANAYGLYDMIGNVAEWVQDCYADTYSALPTDGSVHDSPNCARRIARGGSYSSSPAAYRTAFRLPLKPAMRNSRIGIRVARTLLSQPARPPGHASRSE
jgi:formylglycine-generating enzyme required for sulfatase activity